MRQSEILGLRWSDVDLDTATLSVSRTLQRSVSRKGWLIQSPKTKRSRRTIPLTPIGVEALQRQRKAQASAQLAAKASEWAPAVDSTGQPIANTGPEALIFTNGFGHPLMGNVVTKRLRRALKDAGLPANVHVHSLRHSTASLLLARGIPARVAMDILGHSNIATTQNIYQHVAQVQHREAVAAISEALA
jgi:integrase